MLDDIVGRHTRYADEPALPAVADRTSSETDLGYLSAPDTDIGLDIRIAEAWDSLGLEIRPGPNRQFGAWRDGELVALASGRRLG